MNICINGLAYQKGIMGGVETYLQGLIRYLPDIDSDNAYTLLLGNKYTEGLDISSNVKINKVALYEKPNPLFFINLFFNAAMGVDLHSRSLSGIKADVVHYPFGLLFPAVQDVPSVLTFHDMQHEFYPAFFSIKERLFRARTYQESTKRATRLIADSYHVKQCLVDRYGIEPAKIDVVYLGASAEFRAINDQEKMLDLRQKHGLARPFMYYPAATWPHKNHVRLLEALQLLVTRYKFDGLLVLTGTAKQQNDFILKKISELGLENHVKILGYLPSSDLPLLYNMARLLIFPSLFEGFGIPLVEAMACGCPVVAANCTSIPEVLSDAGHLFDPTSVDDLATTVWSAWNDDTQLEVMRQKGLKRAELLTWRDTARMTLAVYEKAFK